MRLENVVATDPRIIVSDNVFVENDGIVFPPSSASTESLAALTCVVSVTSDRPRGRLNCLDFASRRVSDVFPDYRLWLLATQGTWQPDTIRMRRFKLWQWLKNGGMKTPARAQDVEILRVDPRGIRWFSVAEIGAEELSVVNDIVSAERTSFLVAAPEPPVLEDYLAAGWAEGEYEIMTFWRDIALVAAREGRLLFRPFGYFDDVEVGVDVIGAPGTITMLKADGSVL